MVIKMSGSADGFYLILSDSHGRLPAILEILSRQRDVPLGLIFLGDGTSDINSLFESDRLKVCGKDIDFFTVSGNCDFTFFGDDDKPPLSRVLLLGTHRVFMTHGHPFGVKSGYSGLAKAAHGENCSLALFGHTHTPCDEVYEVGNDCKIRLFNPGSVAEGSFGVLTLKGGEILLSHGEI